MASRIDRFAQRIGGVSLEAERIPVRLRWVKRIDRLGESPSKRIRTHRFRWCPRESQCMNCMNVGLNRGVVRRIQRGVVQRQVVTPTSLKIDPVPVRRFENLDQSVARHREREDVSLELPASHAVDLFVGPYPMAIGSLDRRGEVVREQRDKPICAVALENPILLVNAQGDAPFPFSARRSYSVAGAGSRRVRRLPPV